jgi:DNA-binding MarR family transcriptional regulator
MHPTLFELKRAFHASLKFSFRALRPHGVTPARFDMMFVLYSEWRSGSSRYRNAPVDQTMIRKKLGVSRATVSRMLQSLEALQLVRRTPSFADRRTREVRLTLRGLALFRRAMLATVGTGIVDLAIRCIVAPLSWFSDRDSEADIRRLEERLYKLARAFGDDARLTYTWVPLRGPLKPYFTPSYLGFDEGLDG